MLGTIKMSQTLHVRIPNNSLLDIYNAENYLRQLAPSKTNLDKSIYNDRNSADLKLIRSKEDQISAAARILINLGVQFLEFQKEAAEFNKTPQMFPQYMNCPMCNSRITSYED